MFRAFLLEKYNTVYTRIPKTASRSVWKCIRNMDRTNNFEYKDDYKSFTIVRNPLDRFISGFTMFIGIQKNYPSVEETIEFLKSDSDKNRFYRVHLESLHSEKFQIEKIKKIFKFEDLPDVWPDICDYIGLEQIPELPIIGKQEQKIQITNKEKDMILKYFEKDFERFGYEMV